MTGQVNLIDIGGIEMKEFFGESEGQVRLVEAYSQEERTGSVSGGIIKTLEYFLCRIDVREVEVVSVQCTPRRVIGTALWRIVDIWEDVQISPRRWIVVGW